MKLRRKMDGNKMQEKYLLETNRIEKKCRIRVSARELPKKKDCGQTSWQAIEISVIENACSTKGRPLWNLHEESEECASRIFYNNIEVMKENESVSKIRIFKGGRLCSACSKIREHSLIFE